MEEGSPLFTLNATAREQWLMRLYGRPYWCTRLAALGVLALACGPGAMALALVHAWLVRIGLLRMASAGSWPFDWSTAGLYMLCAGAALLLGRLAFGLWMFRLWAWWLAMFGSLLAGLGCLVAVHSLLWLAPLCGAVYALLMLSYPIFADRMADIE